MIISIQDLAQQLTGLCQPSPLPTPPPAVTSPQSAPPPSPVQIVDYAAKGYHLDAAVLPVNVVSAARLMDQQGFILDAITGVDWLATEQMEVVYDYFHPAANFHVVIRSRVPRGCPEIPTISEVFLGANWHERETHDFFGIRFIGHPNLIPILLPEDADYHPLRKDFAS
jgi:NADH-quinone oxidoreductase subunit C